MDQVFPAGIVKEPVDSGHSNAFILFPGRMEQLFCPEEGCEFFSLVLKEALLPGFPRKLPHIDNKNQLGL